MSGNIETLREFKRVWEKETTEKIIKEIQQRKKRLHKRFRFVSVLYEILKERNETG